MTTVRLPTPLRSFAEGQKEVEIDAGSVADALHDLTERFPGLQNHLFDDQGNLRMYVNVYLNDEDVRDLQGIDTVMQNGDRLMIVPSIAGGQAAQSMKEHTQPVDHSALRTNQAFIIALLGGAYIADGAWLVPFVGVGMVVGSAIGTPAFRLAYALLKRLKLVRPDILPDHMEPHLFAQGFGGVVLLAGSAAWLAGLDLLLWALAWLVIALAALNLFGGFCVGCAVYYWLNRLGVPGFKKAPPPGTNPGRPPHGGQVS